MFFWGIQSQVAFQKPWTNAQFAQPRFWRLTEETFQANWGPHYDEGVHFGVVLSLFYPCFTGPGVWVLDLETVRLGGLDTPCTYFLGCHRLGPQGWF